MKKSELIKRLQKQIEIYGDCYLRSFKISEYGMTTEYHMNSKKRKTEDGNPAKMSMSEFAKFVESEPTPAN